MKRPLNYPFLIRGPLILDSLPVYIEVCRLKLLAPQLTQLAPGRSNFYLPSSLPPPHLHGPPVLDELGVHLVLQVVHLLREVHLRRPRLNLVPLAERHPAPRKLAGLRERVERQHGPSIIRQVAGDLLCGVVQRQDGQDGVGRRDGGLLHGVHGGNEDVHRGQAVEVALALEPELEPVEVRLTLDGHPLGELIEQPGDGEPDLAADGDAPQPHGVERGVQQAPAQEEREHDEADHDDEAVRVDEARWVLQLAGQGLTGFVHADEAGVGGGGRDTEPDEFPES